jgi:hypothetical protein
VCEDGAAGETEGQAGGGPVRGACAANPRSRRVYEPPGAPNFFSKMTVFFSTHSIENFASIYGS